ncbi:MAG: 30S ribosomal protein S12 methylthiotransferase RimO [Polyangiaceae bacterium]
MQPRKLHLVSLGCPKNRVDSEVMLGLALGDGFEHVGDPADAEVIVVNTCGFIGDAKKESIDTIFEMARYRDEGHCQKLVVTGCLAQRHPKELSEQIPEIDHLLGSSDMMRLGAVLRGTADRIAVGQPADWLVSASSPRVLSTRRGSAYVKIAEGCNRSCSFCVIPALRGKQRSRGIDDVVREVESLVAQGVKEVNLVSQDTVAYGRDRPEKPTLAALVRAVAEVPGLAWVRVFYLYPETLTDELIELYQGKTKVVPYVDMPLQHAADPMLRRMKRGHGGARLRKVVERLRGAIPGLFFRTAFIVGHPGETEEEFSELVEFVKWAEFDRVGLFRYSDEETSASFDMADKVPARTANRRLRKLQELQRRIMAKKNEALIGRELEVLVEGESDEHEFVMMARHAGQAPEIDGQVYLSGGEAHAGELRRVTITQAAEADLVGELHDPDSETSMAPPPPAPKKKPRKLNVVPA